MAKSSGIVYRNWAVEYGSIDSGSSDSAAWEPGAPESNMLTPQAGQVAIHDGSSGVKTWRVLVGADSATSSNAIGRPVGCVALVNCNLIMDPSEVGDVLVHLIDEDGATATCQAPAITLNGSGGAMSSIVWMVQDDATGSADLSAIVAVEFEFAASVRFGSRDPWTGGTEEQALRIGTVVAGPLWRPINGIKLTPFVPGSVDLSPVIRTIGATVWSSPQTRMRRLSGEFALLPKDEVEARPPLCGLRQLADHCGISRPLLLIPSDTDRQDLAAEAVYGHFTEDIAWSLVDKKDDVPQFRCPFNILESK